MMEPATDAPLKEAAAGPGEPSGADALRTRHRLGAVLVIVVALLYVGSGVAIQTLFDDMNFEKPFLFSYVSVSLCSSYLLHVVYLQSRRSRCRCCTRGERRASYRNLLPDASVDADAEPQLSLVHKPAELLRSAVMLSPAYFALNYTYFLSLDLTTVSETMVISASTGATIAPPAPLRRRRATCSVPPGRRDLDAPLLAPHPQRAAHTHQARDRLHLDGRHDPRHFLVLGGRRRRRERGRRGGGQRGGAHVSGCVGDLRGALARMRP